MNNFEQTALKIADDMGAYKFVHNWYAFDEAELSAFANALRAEILKELAEQEPVAIKIKTQQFSSFQVSFEDAKKLQALPAGTSLYAKPSPAMATWINYVDCKAVADEYGLDYNKFCAAYRAMLRQMLKRPPKEQA